jgi:hypothetical protein
MPEEEIAARGGAKRWRTVKLSDGRTVRVAVVRKAGPRGGHTVAGKVRKDKKRGEK